MKISSRTDRRIALREIFLGLRSEMVTTLTANRRRIKHPGTQGSTTELRWLEMLNSYLPKRYRADNAFVLDHQGRISDQIDVVIYDRQYSPLLFNQQATKYVPAESVYAVFEVRPTLDGPNVKYAGAKAASESGWGQSLLMVLRRARLQDENKPIPKDWPQGYSEGLKRFSILLIQRSIANPTG